MNSLEAVSCVTLLLMLVQAVSTYWLITKYLKKISARRILKSFSEE